jgi:hypothetical protein
VGDARRGVLRNKEEFPVAKTKAKATATANNNRKAIKHWERPSYLDTWGPPKFQNERYLFREPDRKKHYDALVWAGNQIAFLMQAALDVLGEHGIPEEEASEKLRLRLREARREEAEEFVRKNKLKPEDLDARTIATEGILPWEAALGVSGEVMINTPTRYLRRFYGGDPWDQHLSALILDIMGAEGEGMAQGMSGGRLTFRTNRFSCGGDPFDEWVVEPVDEDSVGRARRIPPGRAK